MKTLTNDEIEIILSNFEDRIEDLEEKVEQLESMTMYNTINGDF